MFIVGETQTPQAPLGAACADQTCALFRLAPCRSYRSLGKNLRAELAINMPLLPELPECCEWQFDPFRPWGTPAFAEYLQFSNWRTLSSGSLGAPYRL